ncbi:hypothetical protein Btru_025304 [Bulinus truncatus]|nr:hypothetical protein Btru_025304 [Bulinus truncatus]
MEVSDSDGSLRVCHELLEEALRGNVKGRAHRRGDSGESMPRRVHYVLYMVCLGCSVLCLTLTLATFLYLPPLRTAAGKNNMCLCLALLLAQVSLMVGYHRLGSSYVCIAVGMLTHFTWLWMFSWTLICCYRMFRNFTFQSRPDRMSGHGQGSRFVKTTVLSLAVPLAIVMATVLTSWLTSGQIGYGKYVCYLDSTTPVGISMAGPIMFITVCNTVFFLLTVVHIYRIRKLLDIGRVTKDDQTLFFVYVRLSSLTGIFWILAVLSEAIDNQILR